MQVYRSRLTRPSTVAWVLHVCLLGTPVAIGDPPGDVATTRNRIRSDTARQVTGSGEQIRSVVAGGEATFELILLPVAEWPGGTYGHGGAYSNADIDHNVLTVSSGGFRTFWNVMYRNWDPGFVGPNANDGRDDIELRNLQGQLDTAGYSSGVGGALTPTMQGCVKSSNCTTSFGEPGSDCSAGICQYVWINQAPARAPTFYSSFDPESCATPVGDKYVVGPLAPSWFASHDPDQPGAGVYCGQRDTGVPHYFGTLALDVPADAKGTYTLEWNSDPDVTLATQTSGNELIPFAALVPGVLVIPTGACCHGVGTPEAGCMDDQTTTKCAALPQPSIYTEGETCQNPPSDDGCWACLPNPDGIPRARFITFRVQPPSTGVEATATAIRVELTSIASPPGPPASGTMVRYVNAVGFNGSNHGEMSINCPDAPADCPNFACAVLGCVPEYRNWAAEVAAIDPANWVIHVTGNAVVPSSTYTVTHVTEGGASSPSVQFTTGLWADVAAGFGTVNVSDLSAVRDWMASLNSAPCKSRTYLRGGFTNHPANPFNHVSVIDVALVVNVLSFSQPYPGLPIAACP